ncbi:NifB/NifX family molybdenum-iron cluster-binding protein [Vacuolonema iberomarrocanum]|uniref:NifB/NifX family molybdenum-iron cluster-binding protein n=1 Tax=Vacuolonema iberomarrocanum TaxID=3454632 RepID=UPI0019F10C85|nr:nitrogen fixation protein [filamentous cyanobacterium LEGE 07170]
MAEQLIAVAVTNDGSIAAHAGRALQWQVYTVSDTADPSLSWTLDLTRFGCLHEWHVRGDGNRHPLHFVDIAIAASAGEGVRRRLQQRETELLTTSEPNPEKAIAAYLSGNLPEGLPHEKVACNSH